MARKNKIMWTIIISIIGVLTAAYVYLQWPRFEEKMILARCKISDEHGTIKDKATIENLAREIKHWERNESGFSSGEYPWTDVALSILKHPEDVAFDVDDCPDCGAGMVKLRFVSPSYTWAHVCGCAGDMMICPHCKKQQSFNVTMLN